MISKPKKMHIAINATSVGRDRTGIGNYILPLIQALAAIDSENDYTILRWRFANSDAADTNIAGADELFTEIAGKSHFEIGWCPYTPDWDQLYLPTELMKRDVDVYHAPSFILPLMRPCKTVVTYHDATSKLFPENLGAKVSDYYDKWSEISARNADYIICNSEYTANDLMKYYGISGDKVEVTYPAALPQYRPHDDVDLTSIQKQYGLEHPYILYVGTIEMRKNIGLMLQAFAHIKRNRGIRHQMLLVGRVRENFEVEKIIRKLGLSQDVVLAGYVPDDDMPRLYSAADLCVYVSLYEGFGLPPLEAMRCGTPVVVSNVTSIPEVVGDAGIMVDPYNVDEIAAGLYKVLTDTALRERMRSRGLQRAEMFSWAKAARQTLNIYNRMVNYETV